MILLEVFFAILIVILVIFGKIEFLSSPSQSSFKIGIEVKGTVYPLLTISRKKSTGKDNVSI